MPIIEIDSLAHEGVEVFSTTFDGNSIRVDMTSYQQGNYVVNVDGVTAKVIKE